jgi:transposase-like protein
MKKLKINDRIEIMVNDEILTGIITGISTRETDREFWEYYNVELQQKGWSLTFSHVTEKELKQDD